MKTINFQLSSQKCIDEGYVIRPPSPLMDQEFLANPFEIEPMEWYAGGGDDLDGDSGDEESPFAYKNKVCLCWELCSLAKEYVHNQNYTSNFIQFDGN